LLQAHLSYPMLAYYRSQHPNQSWLAALTTVVDVSALAILSAEDDLTFAAAYASHHLGLHWGFFNLRQRRLRPGHRQMHGTVSH